MDDIDYQIRCLVEELKSAATLTDVKNNLELWRLTTDIDWYLFALGFSTSTQISDYIILSNFPNQWMSKYENEKLHLVDPVVKYVMKHQSAIFWDSFKNLRGFNAIEQQDFLRSAALHGLVSGCSIPCNSYDDFAVFSMANRSKNKINVLNESLPLNHFYANQLLESVLKINLLANGKTPLVHPIDRDVTSL